MNEKSWPEVIGCQLPDSCGLRPPKLDRIGGQSAKLVISARVTVRRFADEPLSGAARGLKQRSLAAPNTRLPMRLAVDIGNLHWIIVRIPEYYLETIYIERD